MSKAGKIIKGTGSDGSVCYLGCRQGGVDLFFKETPESATCFSGHLVGIQVALARDKWPRLTWTTEDLPARPRGKTGACPGRVDPDPPPQQGRCVLRKPRDLYHGEL